MNLFLGLLAFEKADSQNKKIKSRLLKSINFILMSFVLFVILVVLKSGSFFYLPISNQILFLLFLIYLFFNLMMFLIQKGLVRLPAFLIIALLLLILFKATLIFGVDFYVVDIMYPLIILITVILIEIELAIFIFLFLFLTFFVIFFLQNSELIIVNTAWKTSLPLFPSTLIVLMGYVTMIFLVCCSFREFELRKKKLKKIQLKKLLGLAPILELGKLSSCLIYEIKNHLSIISIVLQNARADKNAVRDLDLAFEAVEQINKLSNLGFCGMLNKSELEIFNLNLEIKNIISLFKKKSNSQKIKIIFEPNANYQLHADRMKLNKVLVGLVFNAIESYEEVKSDNKHIFIKLVKKPRNLLIQVKDYGIGINKADLPLIFTPYFTSKDRAKFLGLSLYANQNIMIKTYETKIKVESSLAVGSTFTLYIKNKFLLV